MSTFSAKPSDIKRKWLLLDADKEVLGHLATKIAHILRGKHKAIFTPHMDTGDFVVVINAGKLIVTGNKYEDKEYIWHTGHPGGLKKISFKKLQAKSSAMVLSKAVRGMLPKGPLGRSMFKKLKIYHGETHPHQAQLHSQGSL
jgi:large subunit ribosomal protein L13